MSSSQIAAGDLLPDTPSQVPSSKADPILLSVFAYRFQSIAEAMGRSLQQTSISTNIKERLDFSCALFAPGGDLVANAPVCNTAGSESNAEELMTDEPAASASTSWV